MKSLKKKAPVVAGDDPAPVWWPKDDPPPKDWEDGPAVEAWTNRQLDRRTDWFLKPGLRLQIGMLENEIVFIEGKEELAAGFVDDPLQNRATLKRIKTALKNKDFAALSTDPDAKVILNRKHHPGGRNGDPSLIETYYLRFDAIKEIVREIWLVAFGREYRGRKTPPSLNMIVLKRLVSEDAFKTNKVKLNRKRLNFDRSEKIPPM